MELIVIDSNIVFSSLRTKDSKLLSLLESNTNHTFYTPNFLIVEIFKHRERLKEFLELLSGIVQRLRFQ